MKREAGVAERYGEALLTVAEKLGQVESISGHLKALQGVLGANPRLMTFLASPQISAAEKQRLVRAALGQTLPATLVNFICLLIDKRRVEHLPEVLARYDKLWDERLGIQRATVTSAVPLDDATLAQIRGRLEQSTGKQVRVQAKVQPEIIGGVVVLMDNTVIDGSLRRQLDDMCQVLKSARVH